jgi:hypothetical protein
MLEKDFEPLGHRRLVVDCKNSLLPFDHSLASVAKRRNKSIHNGPHRWLSLQHVCHPH